ncbi:MAG: hypothetical protein Q4G07_05945 [Oscillospiraceae bacterium]|nr:hypothetical protein [Oscillospiraceae bacterium]
MGISIHAPRAGRDGIEWLTERLPLEFQSTRPVRGATAVSRPILTTTNISIHAPMRGAT